MDLSITTKEESAGTEAVEINAVPVPPKFAAEYNLTVTSHAVVPSICWIAN